MADPRRSEFGDFLRSRREKLTPKAVGLPIAGRRRRTAGLRREEVAELAGIGVDWYIRLEQGRTVSPSVTTIDALARALRLTKAEHGHLRALARDADRRAFARESVPEPLRRLVENLNQPAYITGRRWDILVWNRPAEEIFAFSRLHEEDRNSLISMLTNPNSRRLFAANWADEAKRMVAQFRATHDLWAGDPAFLELLERLRQGCPEFVGWWEAHDIKSVAGGQKIMNHPKKGQLRFAHASFQANDDPALKLVIYTPV
jgi:transcriptional regulator with XRE-family HTH domain